MTVHERWFALLALAGLPACYTDAALCSSGTASLLVTLGGATAGADTVVAAVTVGQDQFTAGGPRHPGAPLERIPLVFPHGYPGKQFIRIAVSAYLGGRFLAEATLVNATLASDCGSLAVDLVQDGGPLDMAHPADLGVPSVDLANPGFPQPAGTVAINFGVDDTANQVYAQGDLEWKGAMVYERVTRKVVYDPTWAGPFPLLWDDGPWTGGGHEPIGAIAGDHLWGITVFATPPAGGTTGFEYGLIDASYQKAWGNGWVWIGPMNGAFFVQSGDRQPITAQGQTFPAFGTTDLRLTIDTTKLDESRAWDTSVVSVKGSAWAWGLAPLVDDGTGKYVFTMSAVIGPGHPFNHSGLFHTGDQPEFVFVLGGVGVSEYKDVNKNQALLAGVTAEAKVAGHAFAPLSVMVAGDGNTAVTMP